MKRIRAISLFSGAGGMDLGFRRAGVDIIWANDFNAAACETYKENLGEENSVNGGHIPADNRVYLLTLYCLLQKRLRSEAC